MLIGIDELCNLALFYPKRSNTRDNESPFCKMMVVDSRVGCRAGLTGVGATLVSSGAFAPFSAELDDSDVGLTVLCEGGQNNSITPAPIKNKEAISKLFERCDLFTFTVHFPCKAV